MQSSASTRAGVGLLLLAVQAAAATQPVAPDPLAACEAQLKSQPSSPDGYQCLLGLMRQQRPRVGRILEARVRAGPDDPWARFYRALFHIYSGDNVPESEFARAGDGFRRSGSTQGLVYALTSQLGQRCFAEDRCDGQALGLLEEAERIAERSDDLHARRVAQLWWLRWAIKEDDVARAERAEQRLDALPAEDPEWMASLLAGQRAFLAGELRDYEGKLSRYAGLLKASAPGTPQHASALGGYASAAAGLVLRGSFDRAEAEQELRAALSEQDGHGMQVSFADPSVGALSTRAHLALLLGPTAESLSLLEEAIAGARARQGWSYPWYAYWLRARYLSEGPSPRFGEALEAAEASVQRASQPSAAWERARSVLMRAVVRWRAGDARAAREDAFTALAALEQLRARQRDARVRMRYEDTLAFAYELVAGSLLEHSVRPPSGADIADALETMERLRARGLLEILVRGHRARGELDRSIEGAHRRLLDPHLGPDERVALVTRLRADERELRESAGETAELPPPPGIEELQKALRREEALVSFQQWTGEATITAPIEESTSWAVVVTRDRRWALRVAGARDVDAAVRLWLSLLERRDGSDREGGASLYRALLAPVVESLPADVHALIVVPDAVIDRVPLEALPLSGSGPYLGERYSVSVVPSAAIWLRLRGAAPRSGGAALALAEPTLSGAAREELVRLQRSGDLQLPESRNEARRAVSALPGTGQLLLGAEATEDRFRGAPLGDFSLIHIASHALVVLARPERSALVLGAAGGEDGLLTVEEISSLRLDRPLVVLGACRTSDGPLRRGEGTLSLARAFFEAGARTVIANLGSVRDEESAALFERFYRHIGDGLPAGAALTLAKRERIRAGAPAASWASYQLLGDSGTTPGVPRGGWSRNSMFAASLVGLAGLCLLGRRLWRRRSR
jgi:CHAT domain-containing protein